MKTLEVSSLSEGIDSTLQAIDNIQTKITNTQKGVRSIITLDHYLKGRTGEAIRSFYETVHEPFLIFLYQSLNNYMNALQRLKEDIHSYERDEHGLIRQDFLENEVQSGLKKVETVATDIVEEANKEISSIADILSLPFIDMEEFSSVVQTGKDKVKRHIDQLHELDHNQTKALNEVENDLDMMNQYISEMSNTFSQNHSVTSFSGLTALELTTLPTIMKEVYGDLVEEEEKEKANPLVKGLKTVGSGAKGVGIGVYDVGKDTVVGLYDTVTHPIQTGKAMWSAVSHPINTSKYIGNAIAASYKRDMVNGNAESRSHWVTYSLGTAVISVVGTKGAGTVTKAGTTAARSGAAAAKTDAANAGKIMSEFDISNVLPVGPRYQLSPGGNVPYNVVDGKHLRDQMIWRAETILGNKVKGTGKYQVGAYKDIKGVEGLDAHHAGQKAAMKKLVDNYDLNTAPAINVPKVGHTIKGPNGIVSRSTKGIDNPRQLLARDIRELRRVYDDIPNSALKELIELNKKMYPEMRK